MAVLSLTGQRRERLKVDSQLLGLESGKAGITSNGSRNHERGHVMFCVLFWFLGRRGRH